MVHKRKLEEIFDQLQKRTEAFGTEWRKIQQVEGEVKALLAKLSKPPPKRKP